MSARHEPVRISLESTGEIEPAPPPARVWRGRSDNGIPILAFITIAAGASGDLLADEHMRIALETRITSSALITIPGRATRL